MKSFAQNSHYFAFCGPSIVNSCLMKSHFPKDDISDNIVTFNENDEKSSNKVESSKSSSQNIHISQYIEDKNPKNSKTKETKRNNNLCINSIFEFQKPYQESLSSNTQQQPSIIPESRPAPTKKLSPETLCQQLTAELDHFLKVEEEIANFAEVNANVEVAQHENYISKQFHFDDDKEELEEIEKLDAEIAQLQEIYVKKLAAKGYSIQ